MQYVDGFIVPVPKKNLPAYRRMAQKMGKVWRRHGAIEFREFVADDVKMGKRTSFPRSGVGRDRPIALGIANHAEQLFARKRGNHGKSAHLEIQFAGDGE